MTCYNTESHVKKWFRKSTKNEEEDNEDEVIGISSFTFALDPFTLFAAISFD